MALESAREARLTLPVLARAVIVGMAEGYRRNRGLLRALLLSARSHPDPEFRRTAQETNRETVRVLRDLLLEQKGAIRHPHPAEAIEFGLLAVGFVLHGLILEEHSVHGLATPKILDEELVRLFFGYAGIRS
jgi:hypothetical protein